MTSKFKRMNDKSETVGVYGIMSADGKELGRITSDRSLKTPVWNAELASGEKRTFTGWGQNYAAKRWIDVGGNANWKDEAPAKAEKPAAVVKKAAAKAAPAKKKAAKAA
jgi:hypothetical protein